MHEIAFDNRTLFPVPCLPPLLSKPPGLWPEPCNPPRMHYLGMSGTTALYAPLILMDRRPGAGRPGRADHRELRSPGLPAGTTGVAPQVASTRVPVPMTVYYEADPFILRRAGWVPIHIVSRQLTIQWRCQKNTAQQGRNVRKQSF